MAAEYHEFTGVVEEVTPPSGNGPVRFKLGYENGQYHNQKVFQVWPTDYKTKEVNPVAQEIVDLEGSEVTVKYTTKMKTYNGNTNPENTVWEVLSSRQAGNGVAAAPPAAPSPSSSVVDYIDGLADDLKNAVSELRKAPPPTTQSAPPNPTAIPFFQAMDSKGFSKDALDAMAQGKFGVHEYIYLTDDQLDEIAKGAGVDFSSKEPANF